MTENEKSKRITELKNLISNITGALGKVTRQMASINIMKHHSPKYIRLLQQEYHYNEELDLFGKELEEALR
jgi:hypothetical protein